MAIYKIEGDALDAVPQTTFAAAGIGERNDLQRFLRDRIEVIAPNTLVISEEFSYWDDSRRRIDLLAIDKTANLVVIELKRTEDGGHMELQAIRYAAMVSTMTFSKTVDVLENVMVETMTFSKTVDVYSAYLKRRNDDRDAEQSLLDFLEWDEPDEEGFATDVRIVLASAEFSKELTTAVLWLAEHGIDIRCVRIRPYGEADRVLLDVQQVIPLPEAEDYQVRVREKKQEERTRRESNRDLTKFTVTVAQQRFESLPKRRSIHAVVKGLCDAGISPKEISEVLHWRKTLFFSAPGNLNSAEMTQALLGQNKSSFSPQYWFTEDDELIHFESQTFTFTNRWGQRTANGVRLLLDHFKPEHISFEKAD